ncbi:hypothetical protein ACRALDRAFT_1074725 [Sodiomyces alcalophilus JCM 7366]|uniref:uncharacterized protein n=1 Tax=Sodiomyces alcalophilus JCM 7366 TaxID=591952 RepID=UPI0039B41EFD
MPDIDPAALSRPAHLSTPSLSNKSLSVSGAGAVKVSKSSQIIPSRIDLEPLYTALKQAIGSEQWVTYKDSLTRFLVGRLNQAEYSEIVDPILSSPNGEKEHLHNQLVAAIYGNVTREMPDPGLAPWVSANDKPSTNSGNKPSSGDAAERRLKGEVMQLPARDRRRIKDLAQNEYDPYENIASIFTETYRRPSRTAEVPSSATGIGSAGDINKMNFDIEIRKRFAQPLAVESGEFPDAPVIEGRMLPLCYEAGLASGHSPEAAQYVSSATEAFIKGVLSSIFSKTRSNGPGEGGSAGLGVGTSWIQTHRYRRQLAREEEAAQRGELTRDKSGLLPVESRAAAERGPLGMADVRVALEMADNGLAQFPIITTGITYGWREGELEDWYDYTWVPGCEAAAAGAGAEGETKLDVRPPSTKELTNGHGKGEKDADGDGVGVGDGDAMDVDVESEELFWDGAEHHEQAFLDSVLDSCLAVGS